MKNQYVILTGGKNNAGDFLIKYRAKKLFENIREDRKIIDLNAWEKFDKDQLKIVNESKALILMGGPSLQKDMYPGIYKLTEKLEDINPPIISMGIGWKSISGTWRDTYEYPFSNNSLKFLDRINNSGYLSSVRDYHSLNSLRFNGFEKFLMTGCPAYYDFNSLNKDIITPNIRKVSFSLGVSFIESKSMERVMKDNILKCRDIFQDKDFEVVFHHSLNRDTFLSTHNATSIHVEMHNRFANWLEEHNIKYVDISGSAENLMNYYSNVDLHIGYRVHAHIFMNSISKFSILISEDGRSKATKDVIGGIVLDGYFSFKDTFLSKVISKFCKTFDRFEANEYLSKELRSNLLYEKNIDYTRIKNSRKMIDNNFEIMKKFLKQLP